MKVGIVIPTLNRVRKTRRFIHCLERQTYNNFKLYLVDSGSKDGTRELSVFADIPCEVIPATLDDWWSSCTNIGVRKAVGEGCDVILTINDDSIIGETYLEEFLDVLQRHDLLILGNRIDFADEPGRIWALGSYSIWGSPFLFQLRYNGYWADELQDLIDGNEILESMTLCGDGVLIRREVFETIGLYDERHTPQVHGDSEFIMRARRHGIKAYVATRVVLYNDIYDETEALAHSPEEVAAPLRSSRRLMRDIHKVFFHRKSNLFWKPVVYITRTYAPPRLVGRTLAYFYVLNFYAVVLAGRLGTGYFQRLAAKRALRQLVRTFRTIRQWFVSRVFNTESYEPETRKYLEEDWRRFRQVRVRGRRV